MAVDTMTSTPPDTATQVLIPGLEAVCKAPAVSAAENVTNRRTEDVIARN